MKENGFKPTKIWMFDATFELIRRFASVGGKASTIVREFEHHTCIGQDRYPSLLEIYYNVPELGICKDSFRHNNPIYSHPDTIRVMVLVGYDFSECVRGILKSKSEVTTEDIMFIAKNGNFGTDTNKLPRTVFGDLIRIFQFPTSLPHDLFTNEKTWNPILFKAALRTTTAVQQHEELFKWKFKLVPLALTFSAKNMEARKIAIFNGCFNNSHMFSNDGHTETYRRVLR